MKTLSIIAAILAAFTGIAAAQNNGPSDTMVVTTGLAPASICSVTIFEGAALPEPVGVCGLSPLGIPDGLIFGPFPPITFLPLRAGVVLLEPLGEPFDPGSTPVPWPGTNRFVSDVVVRYDFNATLGFVFISDGAPDFASWVSFLASAPPGTVITREETGLFQDVTADLQIAIGSPISVRIISDVAVVPEPGTAALLLAGAGVIGWTIRRRRRG